VSRIRPYVFGATMLGLVWHPQAAVAQCAMCRAALLNSPDTQQLIVGLRQGVAVLLAVPLIISVIVLRRLRRPQRKMVRAIIPAATKE
jgi:hypothetical protein